MLKLYIAGKEIIHKALNVYFKGIKKISNNSPDVPLKIIDSLNEPIDEVAACPNFLNFSLRFQTFLLILGFKVWENFKETETSLTFIHVVNVLNFYNSLDI